MLARTHGQPASPTRLGKEMQVFVERLKKQINKLSTIEFEGKFGGATGNFNAHYVAFPRVDWVSFANDFLAELGLKRQQTTTQIEHYDGLAEVFDTLTRINTILLDFCRDMWSYISFNYFKLSLKEGEVGSSAMPHKVNPIDFENAEGNLGIANALYIHMATKLPVSRLQRDLSDSTVLRSVGVPMGHSVLALKSAIRGIQKCTPNTEVIEGELNNTAVVIAEAYQVILRREGVANGYEIIKAVTRTNAKPSLEDMQAIIDQLPVNEAIKVEMRAITPQNYTGI
jgi:adenylosuccinate lyase